MEATGGEPDVIGHDPATGQHLWADCAAESPTGRHRLCYDGPAPNERKDNKPTGSAVEAAALGITLLTEAEYRALQLLGEFVLKPPAGWPPRPPCAPPVAPCSATAAAAKSSAPQGRAVN